MKLLLDMNISPRWVQVLTDAGFETVVTIDPRKTRVRVLPFRTVD